MNCSTCGLPIAPGTKICDQCGTEIMPAIVSLKLKKENDEETTIRSVEQNGEPSDYGVLFSPETQIIDDLQQNSTSANIASDHSALPDKKKRPGWQTLRSLLPALMSIGLALLLTGLCATLLEEGNFLRRIFAPQGGLLAKSIPFALVALFFWSLIDLLAKQGAYNREEKMFLHPDAQALTTITEVTSATAAASRLDHQFRGRILERINLSLQRIFSRQDPMEVRDIIRQQTESEFDAVNSRYTILRLFIWAMPIIGFIGTVFGIGKAMGNFSAFIKTEQVNNNFEIIKNELGNIAQGLSFAFDTTLLGMAFSLVAMLGATYMRKREEELVIQVENYCLIILDNLSVVQSRHVQPLFGSIDELLGTFRQEIISALDTVVDTFTKSSKGYSHAMLAATGTLQELGSDIGKAQAKFSTLLQTGSEGLEVASAKFNQVSEAFGISASRLIDTLTPASKDMGDAIHVLSGGLSDGANEVKETIDELRQKMAAVREAAGILETDFSSLPAMANMANDVQEKYMELSGLTKQLVDSSEKLSNHVQVLNGQSLTLMQNLQEVLTDMKSSQAETTYVLKRLTGGLTLQFNPAS